MNFRDHQNSAVNKNVDTGSPVITEMDGKLLQSLSFKRSVPQ